MSRYVYLYTTIEQTHFYSCFFFLIEMNEFSESVFLLSHTSYMKLATLTLFLAFHLFLFLALVLMLIKVLLSHTLSERYQRSQIILCASKSSYIQTYNRVLIGVK